MRPARIASYDDTTCLLFQGAKYQTPILKNKQKDERKINHIVR
jgi:hypothetical protein